MPPTNPANPNAVMYNAIEALTQQLTRLNEFYQNQEQKLEQQRVQAHSDQTVQQRTDASRQVRPYTVGLGSLEEALIRGRKAAGAPDQEAQAAAFREALAQERAVPPPAPYSDPNVADTLKRLRQERQAAEARGDVTPRRTALSRVVEAINGPVAKEAAPSQVALPPGGVVSSAASRAPDAIGVAGGHAQGGIGSMGANEALSWAVLGEHGGPAFIRNRALEYYGFQRSMDWAARSAEQLSNANLPPVFQKAGINQQNLSTVSNAMSLALAHPAAAYGGYLAMKGVTGLVGHINEHLKTAQTIGQQFGYGPGMGGQSWFGFRNPFSAIGTATGVGMSFEMEKQRLMGRIPGEGFGRGLTSDQATQALDVLGNQGFSMNPIDPFHPLASSTGQAADIANNFMRPMMMNYPGLSAQDLGQFTPMLRNSATSTQQLTNALADLGSEARTSRETVGQYTSSLAELSNQFQQMGASAAGGLAIGTGFTNATGLPSQFAGQMAQSPMFQGLALSRYGILPSGIGDMNSGAFTATSMAALQMLQHATQGLNRNIYQNVGGHRVLVESGRQAQTDQIASMLGMPSDVVRRMLGDQGQIRGRTRAQEMLGDPTQSTGFWQFLNAHGGRLTASQQRQADSIWNQTVRPTERAAGLSQTEMDHLNRMSNLQARAKRFAYDLNVQGSKDKWNQIANKPNAQTVTVKFTGAAAKVFQVAGITPAKAQANAGNFGYNSIANSITGDLNQVGRMFPGVTPEQLMPGMPSMTTSGAPSGLPDNFNAGP